MSEFQGVVQVPAPAAQRPRGRPPRETGAIIEAAKRVFARVGYSASTVDDIAVEATASTATLYKHFESKAGLFEAVMKSRASEVTAAIKAADDPNAPLLQRIKRQLEAVADVLLDPVAQGLSRAYIGELDRAPELLPLYINSGPGSVIKSLSELLDLGKTEGLFRNEVDTLTASHLAVSVIERYTLLTALFFGECALKLVPDRKILAEEAFKLICYAAGTEVTQNQIGKPLEVVLAGRHLHNLPTRS